MERSFARSLFLESANINEEDPDGLSGVIAALTPGTPLQLVPDPHNPKNPSALQLAVEDRILGWVPDYLVDEVRSYLSAGRGLLVPTDVVYGGSEIPA